MQLFERENELLSDPSRVTLGEDLLRRTHAPETLFCCTEALETLTKCASAPFAYDAGEEG